MGTMFIRFSTRKILRMYDDIRQTQMTIFYNKTCSQFEIMSDGRIVDRAHDYRAAYEKAKMYLNLSCGDRRNERIKIPQGFGKQHIASIKKIANELWIKRIDSNEQIIFNDCIKEAFCIHINTMWKLYTVGNTCPKI